MLIAIGIFLLLHGFAHAVGFLGPWGLAENVTPPTALLAGRLPMSPAIMRFVGILWLLNGMAFAAAGVGAFRHMPWWPTVMITAAIASLLLSILSLPGSKLGIPLNLLIIGGFLFAGPSGFLTHRT